MLQNEDLMNGHPLRVLRTQLDLSQKDFATKVGVSEATILRAENGHRLSPKVRRQLCDRLGKTSEELGLMGRKREVLRPASPPPQATQEHSSYLQTNSSLAASMQSQFSQKTYIKDALTFDIRTEPSKPSGFSEQQQESMLGSHSAQAHLGNSSIMAGQLTRYLNL